MNLYINACVREESRTDRLARALMRKIGEEFVELNLEEMALEPFTRETLEKRNFLSSNGYFSDPMFDLSKQFAEAERIVISAPYWNASFPASLHVYLDHIYVIGIVSRYVSDDQPAGLCKGKDLYYVTTAGGKLITSYGYDYIADLAVNCFGIRNTHLVMAEELDIFGNDPEAILNRSMKAL